MSNGNGVSRGDRNRNARLNRLRELVPVTYAIVGIDLADNKQMVVVTDHDSKVLARRTFRCRAWDLVVALDWAAERAARGGFAGVTVACEPTGHRWRVLGQKGHCAGGLGVFPYEDDRLNSPSLRGNLHRVGLLGHPFERTCSDLWRSRKRFVLRRTSRESVPSSR